MKNSPFCFSGLAGAVQVSLLALMAAQVHGQAPTWPLDGPSFSASTEEIQKAAAKVPAEQFAEATVLFERDAYTIDAHGRVTYRHSMIWRIETKAGVDDWTESSSRWEPWYQKRPEIHAHVIAPDGRVVQLDQKTITDGPANEDEEETYTDARVRKAPLPGLTVGAIVEEETVLEDKSPFFSGGGVYRDYLSRNVPLVHSELVVDAAKELKLQYRTHLLPNVVMTDEEQGGVRHLKFVQSYQPARESSDIKLSTHIYSAPMVEFSTGDSWAAVASAYRQLAEPQIDPEKVKALLPSEASASRLERIQRIVSRLHKEVRYTGLEFGEAALQPQTATEVLKRHYGDCKDKAAMLVAMLRADGIAANMALLDTGPGVDVMPELPGMNQFDHAIVYLPADGKGNEALWIDGTAEYAQVGVLPAMDRGRLALIIADGTKELTLTPAPTPEDDHLTELRNVALADYGPAHITETSLTHGEVDEEYRSDYGTAETREKKTNLETYAKNQYLAKALSSVEHGDGHDFSKPFMLKLDMAEARRGNTLLDDAAVSIPFTGVFYRLPEWFRTDPNPNNDKLTPQQEEDHKKAVAVRVSEYDVHPFITEWRYTITPPEGFTLRAPPEDKSIDMGPAKFTQHYEVDSKGVLSGVLRFDTVKAKYTVDEALALREAVLAAYKQDMITVLFDQTGAKLLAAGKIREALAADRALIERHPKDALHHAQFASAYLEAGMGDRALAEAQTATQLDPKSKAAFRMLGWACQFNAIGIQRGQGFDWNCASAAYKKALELDPDDTNTMLNIAILDEYGPAGERYASDAPMAEAIRQYRAVKEKDKATADEYEDNLLFDLLYSGQYKELQADLEKISSSAARNAMGITAAVAQLGGAAGIKAGIGRADHLSSGAEARSNALVAAGNQLVHLRLYPEAAEILAAGAEGQSNAAGVTQQIELFKQLTPWKNEYLPATDPRGVVQRMFIAFMTGGINEKSAGELLSRHAYNSDLEWSRNLEKATQSQGMLRINAEKSGTPSNVLLDVIAGHLKFTVTGEDRIGYRVTVQSLGSKPDSYFVSKEDNTYKVVTDGKTFSEVGNAALYLLRSGKEAEARSLLDWMRDLVHRGGGDDPLSGPLFPRFWTVGDTGGADAIRIAAASLLASTPAIQSLLPAVHAAWEKAADPQRTDLGLLLAWGYVETENGPALKAVSSEILQKYPDSYEAIELAWRADALLKDWKSMHQLLDEHIAKHPDDEVLLRQKAFAAEEQGDFVLARATEQLVIDKGKSNANDYNMYAWTALFDGMVDADVVKNAQQSVMATNNSSFAELHTLACIYAFQGKTSEARELLLKAMAAENLSEPNSAIWYAFGSIYEQYGINDAAIDAYRKVEKPEGPIGPTDTYVLAQARLKALGASLRN
jgi:tetratricopeptide (TPR) repeat protein/transglutaminase-like putative cysteine protease